MKLIYITSYYNWVLREFYLSNPQLLSLEASDQLQKLLDMRFAWSDVWKDALNPLGYDVETIVFNAELIQKAWAQENGIQYNTESWRFEILRAQIKFIQPDVIFLDDYSSFSSQQILSLKSTCARTKLIFGWCGAPYKTIEPFFGFDFIFSNISEIVSELSEAGVKVFHFKHAFDSRIHPSLKPDKFKSNHVSFSGSVDLRAGWHDERAVFLNLLASKVPIEIASSACFKIGSLSAIIARGFRLLSLNGFPVAPLNTCFKRVYNHDFHFVSALKPPLIGQEMYDFMAHSVATFNIHIGKSKGEAANMRLFEASGIGACLLTDYSRSLENLFEPDSEVVTYASQEECLEKAQWLIENPSRAFEIGQNARKRVLSEHTFHHRATDLHQIIGRYI